MTARQERGTRPRDGHLVLSLSIAGVRRGWLLTTDGPLFHIVGGDTTWAQLAPAAQP